MKRKEILLGIAVLGTVILIMHVTGIGCPILKCTGIPCFGCGMTRAVISLLCLDFARAWQYHPLVYLLPFCVAAVVLRDKMSKRVKTAVVVSVAGSFVVVYMIRLFNPADEVIKWQVENGWIYQMIQRIFFALR